MKFIEIILSFRKLRRVLAWLLILLASGCVSQRVHHVESRSPAQVRAEIVGLMPAKTRDRVGWATEIQVAFAAQRLEPTTANLCAVLAVAEQESGFVVDPVVPRLARVARQEIDRRAAAKHIPALLVDAALWLKSPDGRRYREKLATARTERQLSDTFEDFIGMVPLGKRLFGGLNPVRTAGPMQVSIAFAEAHAQDYPYAVNGSIRQEVFSRRGGMYFGIAHLLGYPAMYPQPLYRFADFNAGWNASRNAAFQRAVSVASGGQLVLDGDLVRPGAKIGDPPGATEQAVRSLAAPLQMNDAAIHRALLQGGLEDFARGKLYVRVFALAEKIEGGPLPRAVLPAITLKSPKITRKLTTAWFAKRVDQRWQRCMKRAAHTRTRGSVNLRD